VEQVYYPGLADHPGHNIASRQQKSFGAMLSFEVKGGVEAVKALFDNLSLFTLAQSLGGVESLISHPSTMTHAGMDLEAQLVAGISQSLVRISVGIEDIEDIINDLDIGLTASQSGTGDSDSGNSIERQPSSPGKEGAALRVVADNEQQSKPFSFNPALASLW